MKVFLGILSLILFLGCQHKPTTESSPPPRGPASSQISNHEEWVKLKQFAEQLDLSASGTSLSVSKGGTSVYAVVSQEGKAIGAVLPENSATKISGEVISYNIARILGVASIYQPGVYMGLKGSNLKAFEAMIPKTPYRESKFRHKEENRKAVLARIAKNPGGIDAIYKSWDAKPIDYDALVDWRANKMNTSHVLKGGTKSVASMLSCKGSKPSQNQVVLGAGKTTEIEAIRQLSSIFLIDALTQQWDRFSGGNLQFVVRNGKSDFVAFDNGGTWGGVKWTQKYLGIVTRFDKQVAQELLDLNAFVNQGSGNYMGMTQESELIEVLGVEKISAMYPRFKESLKLVAQHIRANEGCWFDPK